MYIFLVRMYIFLVKMQRLLVEMQEFLVKIYFFLVKMEKFLVKMGRKGGTTTTMDFDVKIPYGDELLASRKYDTMMMLIALKNQSYDGLISKRWLKKTAREMLGYSYYQANQHAKNMVSIGVLEDRGNEYHCPINAQAAENKDSLAFVYGTLDSNTANYFLHHRDSDYLRYYLYLMKRTDAFFRNNRERPFFYYGGKHGALASLGYNPNSPSVIQKLKGYNETLREDGMLYCHRVLRPFGGDRDTIVVEIDEIRPYSKTKMEGVNDMTDMQHLTESLGQEREESKLMWNDIDFDLAIPSKPAEKAVASSDEDFKF